LEHAHFWKICEEIVRDLNEVDDDDMSTISEIIYVNFLDRVRAMDAAEVPEEIHFFLDRWVDIDNAIQFKEVAHDSPAENAAPEEIAEAMETHKTEHQRTIGTLEAEREFTIRKAPKNLHPTIVFYMLQLCSYTIYQNYRCIDEWLFGAELPEKPLELQEDDEEPGDDWKPDEEEDEPDPIT